MAPRPDLGPRLALFFPRAPLGRALGMRAAVLGATGGVTLLLWSILELLGSTNDRSSLFWGNVVMFASVASLVSGLALAIGLRIGGWSAWRALDRERRWLLRHARRIERHLEPGEVIHHAAVGHLARTLHDRSGDMLVLVTSFGLRIFRLGNLGWALTPIVTSAHTKLHRPNVEGPSLSRVVRLFFNPERGCSVVRLSQVLGPALEIRLASRGEAEHLGQALERLHRVAPAGPGALALLEPAQVGGELAVAGTAAEGQLALSHPRGGIEPD